MKPIYYRYDDGFLGLITITQRQKEKAINAFRKSTREIELKDQKENSEKRPN